MPPLCGGGGPPFGRPLRRGRARAGHHHFGPLHSAVRRKARGRGVRGWHPITVKPRFTVWGRRSPLRSEAVLQGEVRAGALDGEFREPIVEIALDRRARVREAPAVIVE